jgi:AcrR family transcriptional regulator
MVDAAPAGTRRRGRPPATDSADTRRTIVESARRLFAERGYGAVTNKDLAAAAGITTAALYHYVDSKLDLYLAVHRDMQQRVYGRFVEAVQSSETFLGQLDGILQAAHDLDVEDPTLALFVGTVRTDMRRFPEVAAHLERSVAARDEFFVSIVDAGVRTGEIAPENRDLAVEFVRVLLIGLTEGGSESPDRHRLAVDSIRSLLRGELISDLGRPDDGAGAAPDGHRSGRRPGR